MKHFENYNIRRDKSFKRNNDNVDDDNNNLHSYCILSKISRFSLDNCINRLQCNTEVAMETTASTKKENRRAGSCFCFVKPK